MLKSTLIGGGLFGLLGAIPVLNLVNCACCALVIGGGVLAAYLYSKECRAAGTEFRAGSGALVGLVAGLFYAVTGTVVGGILKLVLPQPNPEEVMEQLEQLPFDIPPEALDSAARWMEGSAGFGGLIISFFFTLLVAAVFSTIGGLIGGAAFKVEAAPSAPGAPMDGGTGPGV
jgi:hypothetical protein